MKNTIKKIKRAIKFYQLLRYGAWSWWLPLPSQDKDYAEEHTILADEKSRNKKGLAFKIAKIQTAWYLAKNYILNNDGLYQILEEKKDGLKLYKVSC